MSNPAEHGPRWLLVTVWLCAMLANPSAGVRAQDGERATATAAATAADGSETILVTNAAARHISWVNPRTGTVDQLEVGAAPWGLALAGDDRAYVATAEGIAVLDLQRRERLALVPYRTAVGPPAYGEYRPGGMGIAASPDGRQVYVGVYLPNQPSILEVLDTERREIIAAYPVGARPFQVLVSRDGQDVYSIDHDSFTVTVIRPRTGASRSLTVAPLGEDAFAKPHYAAIAGDGRLLLPIQGRVLAILDPATGEIEPVPLSANTHQHGIALNPTGEYALIVGTGAAADATGGPSLTVLNLTTRIERIVPLSRPHEDVAVSADSQRAYLTGGYTFAGGGWDGISVVELATGAVTELPVPDRPLAIALVL